MTEFIYFLGRFHVLVLHLPIGMLLLTVILDVLSHKRGRYQYLSQALPLCWAATALSAVFTVVLGMLHFSEGGFDGASANAHRNYGISVAVVSLLVWFVAAKLPALYTQMRVVSNLLLLFLVTMTGHYGGNLTHGSTFLVEYAPQPIRSMAGLEPRRPAVTELALADPWHDIVKPMLQTRCVSCHNNDKQSGQLNLTSLAALLNGGKSGPAIIAGDAAGSELYQRITLPESHEDFMPAEGKTSLTEGQKDIVAWWINTGLAVDTTVADVTAEDDIAALLAIELGLGGISSLVEEVVYPVVSTELLTELNNQGWLLRLLQQQSNGLLVSVSFIGQGVNAQMLETLAGANASIVELNLASTGINDELLGLLPDMPALQKLNLSNNGISNAGVEILAGYTSLQVLNLYGNAQVTDGGLAEMSSLSNLTALYVWGTGSSQAGIDALLTEVPELTIYGQSYVDED